MMTQKQAREEAKKRWGLLAFAKVSRPLSSKYVGYGTKYGDVVMGYSGGVKNKISTWEDAFLDAEKRESSKPS